MKGSNPKTVSHEFDFIPNANRHLLTVQSGVDSDFALSQADGICRAVRLLLLHAVEVQSMDGDVAWLCWWAMGAAEAYRTAAGAVA
jgi:hypothetical protein